jgi:hypothetical protein
MDSGSGNVIGYFVGLVFLINNYNYFYSEYYIQLIEECVLLIRETNNNDHNRPFVYFIMNSLIFLMPMLNSNQNNVNYLNRIS